MASAHRASGLSREASQPACARHRTGCSPDGDLSPFDGPGHSPMSPPEAEELRGAIRRLLQEPGPVVVGAAPGASCIGPAYELAFELDHQLRRRRLAIRCRSPSSPVSPSSGIWAWAGRGRSASFSKGSSKSATSPYRVSTAVTKITAEAVEVDGAGPIPSVLSIVIPPLAGAQAVRRRPGLSNPKGLSPSMPPTVSRSRMTSTPSGWPSPLRRSRTPRSRSTSQRPAT